MKPYLLFCICLSVIIVACSKDSDSDSPPPPTCDVRGTYAGTSNNGTINSNLAYVLKENNFAVGSVTVGGATTTYGGYRNTCDSVILSVYYTSNSNYYLLSGKLSADKKTISGNFQNLTNTSDHGTFSLTKQ